MIEIDDVDLGFVVNLSTLREALAELSVNGRRWWIASDPADVLSTGTITIGHGDPGCVDRLNTLYYRVPVLNEDVPRAGTGHLLVLLHPSVVSPEQIGLYLEHGRVVQDAIEDAESFYFPIQRALARRFRQK
jgi:hypothetical protein